MNKYRKKPVIIEAFQLTEELTKEQLPSWFEFNISDACICLEEKKVKGFYINTLEGRMLARINDWIIQGVNGELYPCKPDIFEKTYEEVKDE